MTQTPEEKLAAQKAAKKARNKKRYETHRERICEASRRWHAEHREQDRANTRKWRAEHREQVRAYSRKSKDKHREQARARARKWCAEHRELHCARARKWRSENTERAHQSMLNYCNSLPGKFTIWKRNAKNRNLEWNLTFDYLQSLPLTCTYTGQPLTLTVNQPNTVSLDRIDNSKGYVPGNVAFCMPIINHMKRDLTMVKFQDLCRQVTEHASKQLQPNDTVKNPESPSTRGQASRSHSTTTISPATIRVETRVSSLV